MRSIVLQVSVLAVCATVALAVSGDGGTGERQPQDGRRTIQTTCSSCSPLCQGGWQFRCLQLFYDTGINALDTTNVPRSGGSYTAAHYHDSVLMSPSGGSGVIHTGTRYMLLGDIGGSYSTLLESAPLYAGDSCTCFESSAGGWNTFTIPSTVDPGWKRVGHSTLNPASDATLQSPVDIFITIPNQVDAAVEDASLEQESVQAGQSIDMNFTVRNYGQLTINNMEVKAYLSTDANVTTADAEVGSIGPLLPLIGGANGVATLVIDAAIPSSTAYGKYYLAVNVTSADQLLEYDLTNNWSDVVEVDVTCSPGSDDTVNIALDSNNDLSIDTVTGGLDQPVEDQDPGLLLAVNNNDSDGDGLLDHRDTVVNGTSDGNERRAMLLSFDTMLASDPDPNISGGVITVRLDESDANNCRLFEPLSGYILGAGLLDTDDQPTTDPIESFDIDIQSNPNQTYYIEGVLPGDCNIEMVFKTADGAEVCEDVANITVFRAESAFEGEINDFDEQEDFEADGTLLWSADFDIVPFASWIDGGVNAASFSDGSEIVFNMVLLAGTAPAFTPATGYTLKGSTFAPQVVSTAITQNGAAGTSLTMQAQVMQVSYDDVLYPVVGMLQESRQVDIIAGVADTIDTSFDDGVTYPASQSNQQVLLVDIIRDSWGNPVGDGVPIESDVDGLSDMNSISTDTEVTNGQAFVTPKSGAAPESDKELVIRVGEIELVHTVETVDVVVQSIDAEPPSVEAGSNNAVQLDAFFIGSDGSWVADGTPVVWHTSLGSLDAGTGVTGSIAEGTVQNGNASAILYTASTDEDGTLVPGMDIPGTALIYVGTGFSKASTTVTFTEPSSSGGQTPIRLESDQRTLAGDVATSGSVTIPGIDYDSMYDLMIDIGNHIGLTSNDCLECDINGDGIIQLDDLTQACQEGDPVPAPGQQMVVPYYADTVMTVYGDPDDIVQITVSDPTLVSTTGLDGNDQLTLDSTGTGTFGVQSNAALSEDAIAVVNIDALRIGTRGGSLNRYAAAGDNLDNYPLALAPVEEATLLQNLIEGAVLGGGSGFAAASADLGTSLSLPGLWGDSRDILIQGGKILPGGEDPDGLVLGFAVIGFATSLALPIDAPIAILKTVIKRVNRVIPGTTTAKIIHNVAMDVGKELKNGVQALLDKVDEWTEFFTAIIRDRNFARFLAGCVDVPSDSGAEVCPGGSDELVRLAQTALNRFGSGMADHVVEVASETSHSAAKLAIKVMTSANDQAAKKIKALPDARRKELFRAIADCESQVSNFTPVSVLRSIRKRKGTARGTWIADLLDDKNIDLLNDVMQDDVFLGRDFVDVISNIGRLSSKGVKGTNGVASELVRFVERHQAFPSSGARANIRGLINELQQTGRLADSGIITLERVAYSPTAYAAIWSASGETFRYVGDMDALGTLSDGRKAVYELKHRLATTTTNTTSREIQTQTLLKLEWARANGYNVVVIHREGTGFTPALIGKLEGMSIPGGVQVRVVDDITDMPRP